MIRVRLPTHLRTLARVTGEVQLEVAAPVTIPALLDALEAAYPMLRGTIRDHNQGPRRPFVRFFVCEQDWSHHAPDTELPAAIVNAEEPVLIIGAMVGGSGVRQTGSL
jgi:hypothetical protein